MSAGMEEKSGIVVSVNVSVAKGTAKQPVTTGSIVETGLFGDAHAGHWDRQISLLSLEEIDSFQSRTGRKTSPGEFAENLTIQGLDLRKVALLDRFVIGEVELEVTHIGKKCHGTQCSIFQEVGECVMPKEGLFAKVIKPGRVAAGDAIAWIPRPFRILVVTLSDRASRGEYADLSGPRICSLLRDHFATTRWHLAIDTKLIPDDAAMLDQVISEALATPHDLVLTTGGTGAGPRDITPDVVSARLTRTIPGVMEHIRMKYGATNPHALLSRSVAGVADSTVFFTLPGSVKAVEEYMSELLKVAEHLVGMMHGLGH